MALGSRHFDAGDDVERVALALVAGPQAGVEYVVVGDGDHVQRAAAGDVVQHGARGRGAVAGAGVDVQVGASG